jgi:MoaA/NifB/PqqE/SkfB family radical SAM enzyme
MFEFKSRVEYHLKPTPVLPRVSSKEELRFLIDNDRIATMSLRLPTACNLDCVYCYGTPKEYVQMKRSGHALSYNEIEDLLTQGFQLGLRHVSIVGDGEPLLYKDTSVTKDIFDLIRFINEHNASVTIFSNATLITEKTAKILSNSNIFFVAKQNSLDPQLQDHLLGKENIAVTINKAMELLIYVGLNKKDPSRLSCHTVICKYNYYDIPDMWYKWREKNIIPYVQVWVPPPPGPNFDNFMKKYSVEPEMNKKLFHRLAEIDRIEFGFEWDPDDSYPIAAMGCSVVLSGCGVTPNGNIQLCAYTESPLGNIRDSKLSEIISSKEVRRIRRYKYGYNGNEFHYGCRALAYNVTGDRFKKDPDFWE